MTIHARAFREGDDQLLASLVAGAALGTSGCPNWHVGDVWWGLYQNLVFDPCSHIRLWFDGPEPAGFAWLNLNGDLAMQIAAGRTDAAMLEGAMLEWAEEQYPGLAGNGGEHTLSAMALPDDETRIAVLTRRGYERMGTSLHHFQRSLADQPSGRSAPRPITVRAVADEAEWPARVALHQEVWHPSKVTLEAYRRLRAAPGYRPDLDLVAITDEGRLAAYCICWLDPLTRTGEFEPVGAHPAFRRQGYARAVLLEGLHRLREHGATRARVSTPPANAGARALYEAIGFRIVGSEDRYAKRLA